MPLASSTRLGPYEIISALGKGSMGEVYRARDTRPELDREVAIKILAGATDDPEQRRRFELEARTTGSLNHPNIVAIYDVGTHEGTVYLVEELLDGTTLREPIEHGPLPPRKAVDYARAIAHGLAAAHAKGITHRDLKPENVMITSDGRVKILDFGLAKLKEPAPASDTRTQAHATSLGTVLGTVAYMSPEQVRGQAIDHRSDLFSLGVVLYEMLSGKRPFTGATAADTQSSILNGEPPDLSVGRSIPPGLHRIVFRCLEKQPEQRFQSASDLAFALDGLWSPSATTAASTVASPPGRLTAHASLRLAWGVAALVTLVAVTFAIQTLRQRRAPVEQTAYYFAQPIVTPSSPSAISTALPYPALSPDGRYLAFLGARVAGGPMAVWVRPLNTVDARVIEGTDGALNPFWSADSGSLAFVSKGKLKAISLDGSPLREICDAPDGVAGTWNAEGVILFGPGSNGAIMRVDAKGGQPIAVTASSAPGLASVHAFPSFLPGGHRFLYWSPIEQGGAVFGASLEGGPAVKLVASSAKAEYALGYLLTLDGSALSARGFEPDQLRVTSPAMRLVSDVLRDQSTGGAAFSVSASGILTYRTLTAQTFQMSWIDRSGRRGAAIGDPGPWVQMALSPNDRQLAVQRDVTSDSDIWLFDLDRSVSSKFTKDGSNVGPVWSPDGTELAFHNNRRLLNEVFRQPLAGGGAVAWAGVPAGRLEDWSRDGRYLVMGTADSSGRILVVPITGATEAVVTVQPGERSDESQMSPDGHWISFNSVSVNSGRGEVYLQRFPQGVLVTVSAGGGMQAKWRADGKELFYLAGDGTMMSIDVRNDLAVPLGPSKPLFRTRLTPATTIDQYAVSSDGQRFIVMEPMIDPPQERLTIVTNWTSLLKR